MPVGRQTQTRDQIVAVLNGLPVIYSRAEPEPVKLNAVPAQPGAASPWDAWPVWDFTEIAGFTGRQLTVHWAVFVVVPAADRLGLIAAGDAVTEVVAPYLAAQLPAQIERVEPLQLTFEAGGVAPVVRIALSV